MAAVMLDRRSRHFGLALLAWVGGGAHAQELAPQRDGTWLQNGIELYRRLTEHESLSEKDKNEARVAASYVCAVVDLEKYLVFRADLLKGAVADAKKRPHKGPEELKGIGAALPLLVPLAATRFFQDSPSCDRAVVIVRDYLAMYPEVLPKDADVIIEKALLDAYSDNNEP